MSFFKDYATSIVIFSLIIVGLFGAASAKFGFWQQYKYTPPSNNIDTFDKVDDMNQEAENLLCDVNPESETCRAREGQLSSDELTFIQKIIKGSYGALVTFLKLFGLPKQLLIDTLTVLKVPPIYHVAAYTILLIALVVSVFVFIFTRSDTT